MRRSVYQPNFFASDLSPCAEQGGDAVFEHALLKITNPQKAKATEIEILKDNNRRYENNFSRPNVIDKNYRYQGEAPLELTAIQKATAKDLAENFAEFRKNYNIPKEDWERDYEIDAFRKKMEPLVEKSKQTVVKEAATIVSKTFKVFDGVVDTLRAAKAKGVKLIALTDASAMQVMINMYKSGLPADILDHICVRKKAGEELEVGNALMAGKSDEYYNNIKDKVIYTDGWKPKGDYLLKFCDAHNIDKRNVIMVGDSVKSDGGTAFQANELSEGQADVMYAYARYGADVDAKAEAMQTLITDKEDYRLGTIPHDKNLRSHNPQNVYGQLYMAESANNTKTSVLILKKFSDMAKYVEFVSPSRYKSVSYVISGENVPKESKFSYNIAKKLSVIRGM